MMSLVLERLEQLQAELAVVDPNNEAEAADAIAAIAMAARNIVAALPSGPSHSADTPMQIAV